MAKATHNKLAARLAKLEAAAAGPVRRCSHVVRVSLKTGQPLQGENLNQGMVMLIPEAASLEEWEALAMASQRRLKEEVRK